MNKINVFVRVRPLTSVEHQIDCTSHWVAGDTEIRSSNAAAQGCVYQFDRVFGEKCTNQEVYEQTTMPLIDAAINGFNGTVIAYGQTSSGKTYTMMGEGDQLGIIFHAVRDLFDRIENIGDRIFLVRVSYMEIYNEVVMDLLTGKTRLKIHENSSGEVFVSGLQEEVITNLGQVYEVLSIGEQRRHFEATYVNERSSRSHTIFRITIESRSCDGDSNLPDKSVLVSHVNIVDLAGAERTSDAKTTGDRLREGCAINKSLFTLSQVISKLSDFSGYENGELPYIGYRDSKLTRILQPALGGNSKTVIICNITPASRHETLCTLKFAMRAKLVTTKPMKNEIVSDRTMLRRCQKEIQALQNQISELSTASTFEALQSEKDALNRRLIEKEEKIRSLERLICCRYKSPCPKASVSAAINRRVSWCPGYRPTFAGMAGPQDVNQSPMRFPLPPTPKVSYKAAIGTVEEEDEDAEDVKKTGEELSVVLVDASCQTENCPPVNNNRRDTFAVMKQTQMSDFILGHATEAQLRVPDIVVESYDWTATNNALARFQQIDDMLCELESLRIKYQAEKREADAEKAEQRRQLLLEIDGRDRRIEELTVQLEKAIRERDAAVKNERLNKDGLIKLQQMVGSLRTDQRNLHSNFAVHRDTLKHDMEKTVRQVLNEVIKKHEGEKNKELLRTIEELKLKMEKIVQQKDDISKLYADSVEKMKTLESTLQQRSEEVLNQEQCISVFKGKLQCLNNELWHAEKEKANLEHEYDNALKRTVSLLNLCRSYGAKFGPFDNKKNVYYFPN